MQKSNVFIANLILLTCAIGCGDTEDQNNDTSNTTTTSNGTINSTGETTSNTTSNATSGGTTGNTTGGTTGGTTGDTGGTTGPVEANLSCVGRLEPQDITQETAAVTFVASSFTGELLEGVRVRACSRQDRECLEPQGEGVTDANGEATLTLPVGGSGWRGFLEADGEGLRDTLAFFPNPIVADSRRGLLLITDILWDAFALASGAVQDPNRGSVASIVRDCDQNALADASLTVTVASEQVETVYTDATATPDPNATATSRFGLAGAFNVPVGSVGLEASHLDSGTFAQDTIFARAGTLSQMNLEPQHTISEDWSCLGEVVENVTEDETIERTTRIVDVLSGEPMAGVTVRVCAIEDAGCDNPLDEDVTDAQGLYSITMPNDSGAGFTGYTEYTGEELQSALFYINADNRLTNRIPTNLILFSKSTYAQLLGIAGVTIDDDRGAMLANARDCASRNAEGVVFSATTADERSDAFYTRGGLPSPASEATDASGVGALTNLPPGTTTLEARRGAQSDAYTRADVPVRAGFLTSVILVPSE